MSISTLKLFCLWGQFRRRLDPLKRIFALLRTQPRSETRPSRKPKRVFFEMP